MAGISIKVTRINADRRSRGRVATSTRTLLRRVNADAHPAQIMSVMSMIFPTLDHIPASYQVRGVRYELLRVETRIESGVRVRRAVFKGERAVRKSFAREMRRRHRATRKYDIRETRAEARRRRARACALLAMSQSAQNERTAPNALAARAPMLVLAPLYLPYPTPRTLSAIPTG